MESQTLNPIDIPLLQSQLIHLTQTTEGGLMRMGFLEPRSGRLPDVSGLNSLPISRVRELIDDLNLTLEELRQLDENTLQSASLRSQTDISQFKRFLEYHRFHLKDDSILDLIDDGDVLEVYDHRSIQIWRNWTFFKVCPYSLLELLVSDWNTLFARPSWVVEKLMAMLPDLFSENGRTRAYNLPEYLMTARKFPDSKGMLFKMKYVSPVYNHVGQPVAIFTTGALELLPEKSLGRGVAFI